MIFCVRPYIQTVAIVKEWNEAVKNLILMNQELHKMTTYVDVYDASIDKYHVDHIHLKPNWYNDIGILFARVMTELDYV